MDLKDVFKCGVTPQGGENAGKRFRVVTVDDKFVHVKPWNMGDILSATDSFAHGSYTVWEEPKTMFEDHQIPSTWGNLKKAMEKMGLGDNTRIKVPVGFWFDYGYKDADAKVITFDGENAIYFY